MANVDEIILDIRRELEALPDFGQVQLHLKKHTGHFNGTEVVKITSVKFTDNEPNVTATTNIYHLIKSVADANLTGTLTFSLSFKDGHAQQLTVQDFKKL